MAGIQGLVVGGSLALAALGSALAYVVSAVTSIAPLNLVAGLLGIVAVVAGLSALAGWFKLRRRDMGLLLEASGWAINAEMRLTRRLGVTFTRIPDLPAGTRIDRLDILADDPAVIAQDAGRRHRRRRALGLAVLVGALAAAWLLHRYWPLR
jgi:hypothetical protein